MSSLNLADITPAPGDRYIRNDGAEVRVDVVRDGWVYFVSWRPGAETGCPIRMPLDVFVASIRAERMRREEEP